MGVTYYIIIATEKLNKSKKEALFKVIETLKCNIYDKKDDLSSVSFGFEKMGFFNIYFKESSIQLHFPTSFTFPWVGSEYKDVIRKFLDKLIKGFQKVVKTEKITEFNDDSLEKEREYVFGEPNFKGFLLSQGFDEETLDKEDWIEK